ncbi:MAG: hypothetical protein FJW76_03855 [Actinobacteria bacterium]|nr:hypothetical protein [Actinomycetota bacterium]
MERSKVSWIAPIVALIQVLILVIILLITLTGIALTREFDGWVNLIAEIVIYLLAIFGYSLVLRGLWRQKSWAVAPMIAVQLIVIGISYEDFWQRDVLFWKLFGVGVALLSVAAIYSALKQSREQK